MSKHKILVVVGTRPEAIKMASVIEALKSEPSCDLAVCASGQHKEMVEPIFDIFEISPKYNLQSMVPGQSLARVFTNIMSGIDQVLEDWEPDLVLVHGDTATTAASSLAAYYRRIDVGHVEAGLRTGNPQSPWPEENNRKIVAALAKLHFAPTERSKNNLLLENVDKESVFVTGNTVVDSLKKIAKKIDSDQSLREKLTEQFRFLTAPDMILVTGHRRENFGPGFEQICATINRLSENSRLDIVYPVHMNPNVSNVVKNAVSGKSNVHLIPPQGYIEFVYLMMRSTIILSDSGGIQEEAPSLRKPVLVMRDTTERPEALAANTIKLVGTDPKRILPLIEELLKKEELYQQMTSAVNPYGDGQAGAKIASAIKSYLAGVKG